MWRYGYKRPHPVRDQEIRRLRDKRKRKELRDWFQRYKALQQCELCNENHPATLDFHHRNSATKLMEVGVMVSSVPKFSKEEIREEIRKCIVVCANCHRKLHWDLSQT